MTKSELLAVAKSGAAVAMALGISPQAVSKWGERIPELRLYQLRRLRPRWFRRQKDS